MAYQQGTTGTASTKTKRLLLPQSVFWGPLENSEVPETIIQSGIKIINNPLRIPVYHLLCPSRKKRHKIAWQNMRDNLLLWISRSLTDKRQADCEEVLITNLHKVWKTYTGCQLAWQETCSQFTLKKLFFFIRERERVCVLAESITRERWQFPSAVDDCHKNPTIRRYRKINAQCLFFGNLTTWFLWL